MKKIKKFIFHIKKNKEHIPTNSINAYASWMSILCFGLLLQILSFMSILLCQNSYLICANHQSQLDLSCLSQARGIIQHNNYIRKCHLPNDELIASFDMYMGTTYVSFSDKDTYIQIFQKQENKIIEMDVYYDEKGIVGFDIEKK